MKKNFYSYKRLKGVWMTLLTVLSFVFANRAMAQDTFSSNGCSASNWATTGNCVKTGSTGRDTSPGETLEQQINGNELSRVTNFCLYNKF